VASPNHWEAGKLIQVGNDTNWCQFIRSYSLTQVILRKSDGTLWYWGTNQFDFGTWPDGWPGLRSFSPVQIGSDRDWTGIFWLDGYLGKKSDGSLWRIGIDRKGGWPEAHRLAPRDPTYPLTTGTFASGAFHSWTAYVRPDGSLWANGRLPDQVSHGQLQLAWANQQCGKDTDWLTVANTWSRMVAIKKDGTLWQWNWGDNSPAHPFVINLNSQPARLGIHNDWIALAVVEEGVVTLAADGSLWLWPDRDSYRYWESIIQLPKQPISLGNVFTPAR
jgi:alpha-tubulin suppressor-like RCC1 family protein